MMAFRRPPVAAALALLTGAGLALLLAHGQELRNRKDARERFEARAHGVTSQLAERLRTYEYGLRGARGGVLTAGPEHLTHAGFHRYGLSRDLAREFPGSRGIGIIRRVPRDQEAAFVEAARRDGRPDFAVHQLTPHAGDRYVIQYVEPVEGNREAIGLDIASEAQRKLAAEQAMRTGNATLTQPVTLVQATGQRHRGFLLLLPIYRSGVTPATVAEREADTFGWTYTPLIIDEVLAGFDLRDGELTLRLRDPSSTSRQPFFASPGSESPPAGGLVTRIAVPLFGRTWEAELGARREFVAGLSQVRPSTVGALGGLFALLLAVLAHGYAEGVERTDRELRLRASEALLARTGRAAGVGGWELDLASRKLTFSEQTRTIHELDEGHQPTVESALAFYPEEARELVNHAVTTAIKHGVGWDLEVPFVTARGRALWVRTVGNVERQGTKTLRVVGALQDITERKQAEALIHEANERFSIAADSAGIAFWDFDLVTDRLLCDSRMAQLYRWERSDPDPRVLVLERIHPADLPHLETTLREALRGGDQVDAEFRIVWPDGEVRHLKSNARVSRDPSGAPLRVTGVNLDITERKRAEAELREATRLAQEASRAKSQFLANTSHEIRTPMNAVFGFSYLLGKTALSEEQAALLGKIEAASRSLLAVINDVLDLSKVEAGELIVEAAPFRLGSLLADLSDFATVQTDRKEITFTCDVDPGLSETMLTGDVTRIRQVLTNLLSNAIKFTERGSVTLGVRRVRESDERLTLRFSVADTGIGIDPADAQRVFAPFAQADASTTRRFGGTGLGLSIVRRLTELMGGEVSLRSERGSGSEFAVVLELARATAPALLPSAPNGDNAGESTLSGVRALVVDDSIVNLEMVRRILEAKGAVVTLASDGGRAIELLRHEPISFDIVLMDVHMPELDGNEATLRIRGELGRTDIPIIALTAGALTSEQQRAMSSGMNDFVSKPFDVRDLVRTIRRHVTPPDGSPERGREATLGEGDWPLVHGIDAEQVRARLGGDVALFRSMLDRLLEEFTEVALPGGDSGALRRHAARMHKLRGSAGMLAATAVAELATAAERACRAEDIEQAVRACRRLERALGELRASAPTQQRCALSDEQVASAADTSPHNLREPLAALLRQLEQHELSALDAFTELAGPLRKLLGHEAFEQLRGAVQGLRFAVAAEQVRRKLATLEPFPAAS